MGVGQKEGGRGEGREEKGKRGEKRGGEKGRRGEGKAQNQIWLGLQNFSAQGSQSYLNKDEQSN